jgi:hypothetical protein
VSVFDQPPVAETRVELLPPEPGPAPAPSAEPEPPRPRRRVPRRSRSRVRWYARWYVAVGAAGLLVVAANAVTVDGDDLQPDTTPGTPGTVATSTSLELAAEPAQPAGEDAPASSLAPDPAPAVTVPAVSVPAVSVPAVSVPAETVPAASVPDATSPPPTAAGDTTPIALTDVVDATGSMAVQLPDGFQTDVDPVEIDGVHLHQVTGAADLAGYQAGDLSVFGATVLDAPLGSLGAPSDLAARADPGTACRPAAVEPSVTTAVGEAIVLSYEGCGPAASPLVVVAANLGVLQRSVLVRVQGGTRPLDATRLLAITILESFRGT